MTTPAAIITGAGGGIGRAAAIELARRGYRVALVGRRSESLNETASLISTGKAGALVIPADITIPADVARIVAAALNAFGQIDALINNAGLAPVKAIEETSIDDWHAILNTNLSAAFYLSKAVWPLFRQQWGGAIVNISSMAARDPFPGFAAYSAAKAGLNLLSLSLAREGAKDNIRVYTIAPGAVETDMFRGIMTPEQFPPEQTLAPADVACVIAQCIQGDLKFTSGEVIWLRKTV